MAVSPRGSGWHRGHGTTYGRRVGRASGAKVVVAQETRIDHVTRSREVDFGDWEGPVDVYETGSISTHQAHDPFRQTRPFRLEDVIFG